MKKKIIATIFVTTIFSMTSSCVENHQEQMVDFVYERDAKDVLKIIHDDWRWLFTSKDPDYNLEYVLQNEIPNEKLSTEARERNLKMKVLREKERVAGFVTFYKETSDVGRIRLVSVAKDFKEKVCGRELTVAAVRDLFASGCTSVYLFTHKKSEKVPVYESLGFQEDEMPQEAILWWKENKIPAEEYVQYARYSVNKKTFKPGDNAAVDGSSSK